MNSCGNCESPFQVISAKDPTTRNIIMKFWHLRRSHCRTCIDDMQKEWKEMKWAESLGIPTINV